TGVLAESFVDIFLEVFMAPSFEREALDVLHKMKNIRLIEVDITEDLDELEFVSVYCGYLVLDKDNFDVKKVYI
ncbi:bifunctional phosphoribosylaminoimidazolecarboxamide formyltransferase/IMP cyclohydrolase, partial [Staphylococcus felis]|nr:bifunctional phosphoribosylaminoimidazolecarboxamide formyltransferase/IMP cyclohydrolase [Staphylococcus felis]